MYLGRVFFALRQNNGGCVMGTPIPSGLQIGGEATSIVQALRDFGRDRSVPIGFVARAIGREPAEIRDSLVLLNSKNIVRLDESHDSVTLVR